MCRCICKALEIKTMTYQTTIKKEYTFEGKGLHSGKISKMKLKPAAAGTVGNITVDQDIIKKQLQLLQEKLVL